ncbi:MAG: DUF3035 domain-containing protein [Roseobacter sp.]
MSRTLAFILMTTIAGACSNQGLVQVRSTTAGPDEFMVEPKAELETPENIASLPPPTPGQGNRADIDPMAGMITELGGRQGDPNAPVPASDGALVTAASRYGVAPDIRNSLAAEDAEFRRRKSRFTQFQLFPDNLYYDVYRSEALDARATADAWRRSGARTPSYPPPAN